MEANTAPPLPAGSTSPLGRMFNVLVAPAEVFEEIKELPVRHSNWFLPAIIYFILGSAVSWLLFSHEFAVAEIKRIQRQQIEKTMAERGASAAEAEKVIQMVEQYAQIGAKIAGVVFSFLFAFGVPFLWAFGIWLIGVKFFKADFEYMKAVECAGLCLGIYLIAAVISSLGSMAIGKLLSISPAFFMENFDFGSRLHQAIASINPFYLWFAAACASAVAVLSGVSWGKAAAATVIWWVAYHAVLILIRLGQLVM